jgi:peptide/nickel transport system ATP-binding protein
LAGDAVNPLDLRGVQIRYGRGQTAFAAVAGVDLAVAVGQTHGLVGESGSGKSTLARAVVGLQPVTGGCIRVSGTDVTNARGPALAHLRRRVQMVFQNPYASLNPRMRAGDAIGEALRIHRSDLPAATRERETADLLALVGLDPASAGRWPHQFSGGQRQRLAIARALATGAPVIVLDEITSALDVSVQATILNLLRDIQRQRRLSLLFISHDLAVVRYMSDVVSVMHLGRIVESAPTDTLFSAPLHPYTRALLDAVPRLGAPTGAPLRLAGEVPDPRAPPSGCRFHSRCPVGPQVNAARQSCISNDPVEQLVGPGHRIACHFHGLAAAASTVDGGATAL